MDAALRLSAQRIRDDHISIYDDYDDRARRRRTLADLPPLHTLSNREWLAALDAEDDIPPLDAAPAAEWQIGGIGAADELAGFGGMDATGSEDHE